MIMNRKDMIENAGSKLQNQVDSLIENSGFNLDITTLTGIRQKVSEQKHYMLGGRSLSDYGSLVVGSSAFLDEEVVWIETYPGGDPETGVIAPGSGASESENVDAKYEDVRVKRHFWSKHYSFNILETARAFAAGKFNIVEAKEKSLVRNWNLLIQKTFFLGLSTDTAIKGLLNQDTVTTDLDTTITKSISSMSETEFQALLSDTGPLAVHYDNSGSTAYADTFLIPTSDFNGLGSAVSETFNMKSRLQRLEEAFRSVTGNPNFQVLPCAYCDSANNDLGVNRYVMYVRNDDTTMYFDMPVDYTPVVNDTINGMFYKAEAYGQFGGVVMPRPAEAMYFDYTPA